MGIKDKKVRFIQYVKQSHPRRTGERGRSLSPSLLLSPQFHLPGCGWFGVRWEEEGGSGCGGGRGVVFDHRQKVAVVQFLQRPWEVCCVTSLIWDQGLDVYYSSLRRAEWEKPTIKLVKTWSWRHGSNSSLLLGSEVKRPQVTTPPSCPRCNYPWIKWPGWQRTDTMKTTTPVL